MKYTAKEGFVFDWADLEAHKWYDEENKEWVQEHLYVTTIYLGIYDSIDNYVEVPKVEE